MSINLIVGGVKIIDKHVSNAFKYGIGYKNGLPWGHLREDMKLFRDFTLGKYDIPLSKEPNEYNKQEHNTVVIMGRKTMESIPNNMLPKRDNIVISRTTNNIFETKESGHLYLNKLREKYTQIWVIGGSQIYNLFLTDYIDLVDNIVLNELHLRENMKDNIEFDTYFPRIYDINYNKMLRTCQTYKKLKSFSNIIDVKDNEYIEKIESNVYSRNFTLK